MVKCRICRMRSSPRVGETMGKAGLGREVEGLVKVTHLLASMFFLQSILGEESRY